MTWRSGSSSSVSGPWSSEWLRAGFLVSPLVPSHVRTVARAGAASGCVLSPSSYDDRSSDRRLYDRRYYGSYRRNGCSRDRGEAYCEPDYRHSYEYHREDSSYRSQRSSRRKHRRRRRRSRTFSRSSSVSAGLGPSSPHSSSAL